MWPEGQLAGLSCALRFLKVDPNAKQELMEKAAHTLDVMKGWKGTVHKEKRELRKEGLEELLCQGLSLDEVNQMVDKDSLWKESVIECAVVRFCPPVT